MVKFFKQFLHHQVPEWKEEYLDYESLNLIIEELKKFREATNQRNNTDENFILNRGYKSNIKKNYEIKKSIINTLTDNSLTNKTENIENTENNDILLNSTINNKNNNVLDENLIPNKKKFDKNKTISNIKYINKISKIEDSINLSKNIRSEMIVSESDKYCSPKLTNMQKKQLLFQKFSNQIKNKNTDTSSFNEKNNKDYIANFNTDNQNNIKEEKRLLKLFIEKYKNTLNNVEDFFNKTLELNKNTLDKLKNNYIFKSDNEFNIDDENDDDILSSCSKDCEISNKDKNDNNDEYFNNYNNNENNKSFKSYSHINKNSNFKNKLNNSYKLNIDLEVDDIQCKSLKINKLSKFNVLSEKKSRDQHDAGGYSTSWKRAFTDIYTKATWLHGYATINKIAIYKILKKFYKIFIKNCLLNDNKYIKEANEEYNNLEKFSEELNFYKQINHITLYRLKIVKVYSNLFCKGNLKEAKNIMEEKLDGGSSTNTSMVSFYFGVFISLLFMSFLITFIPDYNTKEENLSILIFFPPFNFMIIIFSLFIGLAINIKVFNKYKVNYIYIFEFDPDYRLSPFQVLKIGFLIANTWVLLYIFTVVSLHFDLFSKLFWIFPLIGFLITLTLCMIPFHINYYYFRKSIRTLLLKNLFPLGESGVRFKDFIFGDILTSLSKPITSIVISFCLLYCIECKENNTRSNCNRNATISVFASLIPYVIRFFQCLNKWYYTKNTWPHGFNALKYIGAFTNTLIGWMYATKKISLFIYLIIGFVSVSYLLFWDYYMDWGLFRNFKSIQENKKSNVKNDLNVNNQNDSYYSISNENNINTIINGRECRFLLRDKLMYPSTYYYVAMLINFILRLIWLVGFIQLSFIDSVLEGEIKIFFFSFVEILRRIIWTTLRVENENVNNLEKYRSIMEIPSLPDKFNDS